MARRDASDPREQGIAPNWAWAWPANRRILYNRASADLEGNPWNPEKPIIRWSGTKWVGIDVPDYGPTVKPSDSIGPFIMNAEGVGRLFARDMMAEGPFPEHYEPFESPVPNVLHPKVRSNPAARVFPDDMVAFGTAPEYPFVATTYRLTEHHTAGGMSRWLPYLSELQPEMFCEVSSALASERGLENGGWATLVSPRAVIEARVLVTERVSALRIDGRIVHQIGLPYHWGVGREAVVSGDSANDLLGLALDPNVQIQESKAGSCDIRPGRRPRGPASLALVAEYRRRAGLTPLTDGPSDGPSDGPVDGPARSAEAVDDGGAQGGRS